MEYAAAAGTGGYYYYPPAASQPQPHAHAQMQTLRRRPRPAARWVKQWIPQDLASPGSKCALFKWVREDVYKNLKENGGTGGRQEPEAPPRKAEPATEILFLCSYDACGKTFVDVAALRKHAHVHGERQYVCQEPGCGKKFVDSSKLKRHHLTHTGQKDFVCPQPGCGKAFSLDFNLRAHLKTHAVENYHVCPFPACGKRFTSDFKLKCHIKTHEKTGSPIAVQYTPPAEKPQSIIKPSIQAFQKPPALALPSFSAERPHVCPYEGCGKAYIHSYKLNLHLKTQHLEHSQEDNARFAAPAGEYNYAEAGDLAPNPKRSKTNQAHKAPPSNAYSVKVSSRMSVDTSGAKNQWPGKGMYDDDSEETEEDHGGNNVEDGWRYSNQNADDEETEEDED